MYVDEREKPEFILKLSDEGLFLWLGLVDFQIERYGSYDPNLVLKADFGERGKAVFQKYANSLKLKICKFYKDMKESGVLDTTEKTYFFILGFLMANDVYRAIAVGVAALVAKQGLYSFCKEI